MTGAVVLRLNHLPIARVKRLGAAGGGKADEALPENAIRPAGSDSRIDIVSRSGAQADKAALQSIGLLMLLATLFVILAGAFAVNRQLAADLSPVEAASSTLKAGPPAVGRAVVS